MSHSFTVMAQKICWLLKSVQGPFRVCIRFLVCCTDLTHVGGGGGGGKLSKMTHTILFSFHCIQYVGRLGLATSCSRFPKKWPEISQSCSKKMSKVAFCNETCSKGAKTKAKTCFVFSSFIWSDAKICNLYNKSNISKHCCAILRYNQHR